MKELNIRNITMMALVACCLMQVGAQLYALSVVASTVSAAPPRSFAILQGEYRYDSSSFWNTVPTITFVLFIIALVANWKTSRRSLLLFALVDRSVGRSGPFIGAHTTGTITDGGEVKMSKQGIIDKKS